MSHEQAFNAHDWRQLVALARQFATELAKKGLLQHARFFGGLRNFWRAADDSGLLWQEEQFKLLARLVLKFALGKFELVGVVKR